MTSRDGTPLEAQVIVLSRHDGEVLHAGRFHRSRQALELHQATMRIRWPYVFCEHVVYRRKRRPDPAPEPIKLEAPDYE